MKTILVDAVFTSVYEDGTFNNEMLKLLQSYPNKKLVLTNANDEMSKKYNLDKLPFEVFSLKNDPNKTDPAYYKEMLKVFKLKPDDVIYFEHDKEVVKSTESIGIKTHYYDEFKKDLVALKAFLDSNL